MKTRHFSDIKTTLDYFFESRPHGTIKLGLERIYKLLEKIGNPQKSFNSIQIAGTNGKGSVTRMLSTIFTQCGYKTGANYSPHLIRFNERITLNNELISDDGIIETANEIYDAVREMDEICEEMKPSFFECTTAMAFKYFERMGCEIAVVEVGLGGRLDATSALEPIVNAITSIGLDHVKTLGDTIEKIAFEKAGIIKKTTPIICGSDDTLAIKTIKEVASQNDAPLFQYLKDYSFQSRESKINLNRFDFFSDKMNIENILLNMNGQHQFLNASTAIMTYLVYCDRLKLPYNIALLKEAMGKAFWPGRFEIISKKPLIVVDGAHNSQGIDSLVDNWNTYYGQVKPVLLTGMLSGKDYTHMVKKLSDISQEVIITEPHSPRDTDTSIIVNEYKRFKKIDQVFYIQDHEKACTKALDIAKEKGAPILITGSLYVIGYLKDIFLSNGMILLQKGHNLTKL